MTDDPRIAALPDIHGHAKGEHKPFAEERPIPYTARMLFLWFYHACRRGSPRFLMVADHMNYLTFEDPAAVNLVRRALKLAQAGDLYGAAETAGVELGHAATVCEGLRKGIRYSIGAEVDNDPRCRPDAQNIVDAMRPDGMIRSVHFLPIAHPQYGENWMWPFDNPEFADLYELVGTERVWEIYMATLLEAVEKLPGHIVAHFYVPAKFGHWPDDAVLDSYEDRLLEACAARGMAVEINSRYLYKFYAGDEAQLERFRTAHLRLLRKAKEKGVAVAVGSDAHSPKDQGRGFAEVLALLDEAEINEIAFPLNGRLARVALRATEEILRQHGTGAAAAPHPSAPSVNGSSTGANAAGEPAEPVTVAAAPSATEAVAAETAPAETASAETASAETAPAEAAPAEVTAGDVAVAEATPVEAASAEAVPPAPAPPKRPARKRPPRKKSTPAAPLDAVAAETPARPEGEPELPAAAGTGDSEAVAQSAEAAVAESAERGDEPVAENAAEAQDAKSEADQSPPPAPAPPEKPASRAKSKPRAENAATAPKAPAKTAASKPSPKKAAPKTAAAKTAAKAAASKKSASRPAAKPAKKAAAKKTATARAAAPAKATKRATPKRAVAAKKSVAKKAVKKKAARPRR